MIYVAAKGQRVNHVTANVRNGAGILFDLFQQGIASFLQPLLINGISRLFSLRQSRHHIGGHEGVRFIRLPPAPATILMLEQVKAFKPGGYFLVQFGGSCGWCEPQIFNGFRHQDVGQEA